MTTEDVLAMTDDEAITSAILLDAEFRLASPITGSWAVRHPSWRTWDGSFGRKGTAARAYLIDRLNLEK